MDYINLYLNMNLNKRNKIINKDNEYKWEKGKYYVLQINSILDRPCVTYKLIHPPQRAYNMVWKIYSYFFSLYRVTNVFCRPCNKERTRRML